MNANTPKIGVCEFCLPCGGPVAMELAARAGFQGMQLGDAGGAERGYPFRSPAVREAYLEAADRLGLSLQAMHLHALFHSRLLDHAPDTAQGEEARESIRQGIAACRQMGIPTVMITVTNVLSLEQYDNVCDGLSLALRLCGDAGVTLAVETDFPPERFRRLRERVGEGVRLCFDTMNPTVYGIGRPADLILQYGMDVIDHFHVKDCCRNARGYFTKYTTPFRLIGQGESGFDDCAEVISAQNYGGWLISETFYYDKIFSIVIILSLQNRMSRRFGRAFSGEFWKEFSDSSGKLKKFGIIPQKLG